MQRMALRMARIATPTSANTASHMFAMPTAASTSASSAMITPIPRIPTIAPGTSAATPLNALISAWGVPDGAPKLALVIAARIALMPVIAGISYEITVRWAGSHPENPLVKVVLWPGMQMQYLTTNEPDDGMLECAIAAMQQVLEREELEAAKAAAARGAQA